MREREDPFAGFDLRGFLAEYSGRGVAGGNVGDLFAAPNRSSERSSQEEADRPKRVWIQILESTLIKDRNFKELADLDIRRTAIDFKDGFESWKRLVLARADIQVEEKGLIESTTIEDLANAAQIEFNRQARLLGRQIPNSLGYEAVNEQAHKWEVISTIVREASEIRD